MVLSGLNYSTKASYKTAATKLTQDVSFGVHIKYPEQLCKLHIDLLFYKLKIGKFEKLVFNLYGEKEYSVHIKTLK